jgi:hypothetical protein
MSGNGTNYNITPVTVKALWQWDTTYPNNPTPCGYGVPSAGNPTPTCTKTGLMPQDLRDFVGVPLFYRGQPPVAVTEDQLLARIRWAEDWCEQQSGLLLTPSLVASPPITSALATNSASVITTSPSGIMTLGVDYDIADDAIDFRYERGLDDGWLCTTCRHKPLRSYNGGPTAIVSWNYQYPILNEYFSIPPDWYVEMQDSGYVRAVPSKNLQMLPLWFLTISIQGWSSTLPGGFQLIYQAGLSPNDYRGKWSFVKEMVLAAAAVSILRTIQGSINLGVLKTNTGIDGAQFGQEFNPMGAYADLITQFKNQRDALLETVYWQCGGPIVQTL